jgi:hypothetical protein
VGAAGGFPAAGGCARPGFSTCFDAGAIRIEVNLTGVPEPTALFLLGAGLVGLAAWKREARGDSK